MYVPVFFIYEKLCKSRIIRKISSAAIGFPPLLPAEIKPDPPLYYWPEVNDYTMSCVIAETPGGRIWLAWFPGGYDAWEVLLMAKSDDGGDLRTAIYH